MQLILLSVPLFLFFSASGMDLRQEEIKSVQRQLKICAQEDQQARVALLRAVHNNALTMSDAKEKYTLAVDKKNTEILKNILSQSGWPIVTIFGQEAAENAWLIAQHADHDPLFQHDCLNLLKFLWTEQLVPGRHYAYLFDRICINRNKLQFYGTQVTLEQQLLPFFQQEEDPCGVLLNKRRAKVGLPDYQDQQLLCTQLFNKIEKSISGQQ